MVIFDNVTKRYGDGTVAVDGLSPEIEKGEFVVLIGPSGCGKTTTLKMVNRLVEPTGGRILINGKDTSTLDPVKLRREIGYVIQDIGLFPHMTVAENIGIVPRLHKWDKARTRERVTELLKMAHLDPDQYRNRFPDQLSGGQQQRIGVLRALATEPDVILMDEPFGALDPISRENLQDELLSLQKNLKKTIIFVTHDIDEAFKMADRVVMMRQGKIVQMGSPDEVRNRPADDFVAAFIGEKRLSAVDSDAPLDIILEKPFATATPDQPAKDVLALLEEKGKGSIQVVDRQRRWRGMVTVQLLAAAAREGKRVGDAARRDRKLSFPGNTLKDAAEMFSDSPLPIPVIGENGNFLGIVTTQGLANLMIHRLTGGVRGVS